MQPDYRFWGPRPKLLQKGTARYLRVISPAPPKPKLDGRTLRLILLPYASCFTNTRDHVKTTMPIAAHMRRLDQNRIPDLRNSNSSPDGLPDIIPT